MDCRDVAACTGKWYVRIVKSRMVAVVEIFDDCSSCNDANDCSEYETGSSCLIETEVPIKFDVCGTCRGRGSHVNPSIDSNGISMEEFHEDPEFYREYRSGLYDIPCYECGGARVVPVVDEELAGKELADKINNHIYDVRQQGVEDARALRMGY